MQNKKTIIILLIILLLATTLRINHLFDKEKGPDEKLSIRNAQTFKDLNLSSLKEIQNSMPSEANPPLFFMLLGATLNLYDSAITLKILTLIISILSIISFFILAKTIFNEKVALFSTFLYSINPMHLIYSQHIRAYIFLFLLFNLSMYFLYKFLFKESKKSLVVLTIINILSIYTHYYAILFIAGSIITTLILYYKNRAIKIKEYITSNLIILICTIPAFILLKTQVTSNSLPATTELLTPKIAIYPLYKFSVMVDVSTALTKFPYLLILFPLIITIVAYGIIQLYKKNKEKGNFLFINLISPLITLTIPGFFIAVHSFRYLTFLLPIYILMISYGLFQIKNKILKTSLLIIISIGWFFVIIYYYQICSIPHWSTYIAI